MNQRDEHEYSGYDHVGGGNEDVRDGNGFGSPPLLQVNVWALVMHAAKGLEFDEVLLPFWNEGIVPPRPQNGRLPVMVEERKLAFVSLTRARERVMISYAKAKDDNPRMSQRPSPLVEELLCLEEISAAFINMPSQSPSHRLESLLPKIQQPSSSIGSSFKTEGGLGDGRNSDRTHVTGEPQSSKKRGVSPPRVEISGTVGSMWDNTRGNSVDHNGGSSGGNVRGGGSLAGGRGETSGGGRGGDRGGAYSAGQVVTSNDDREEETPIRANNWNEYRSHVNNHDNNNNNNPNRNQNAPLTKQTSPSPITPTSSASTASSGQQQQPQYHSTTTHPHLIDLSKLRENIGNGNGVNGKGAKATGPRSRGKNIVEKSVPVVALTQATTSTSTDVRGTQTATTAMAAPKTAAKKERTSTTSSQTTATTTTTRASVTSDNHDNDDGASGDTMSPLTPQELTHILAGSPALLRQKGMKERIKAQLKNLGQEGGNSILVTTSDGKGTEKKQFSKLNIRQLGEYLHSLWHPKQQ